MKELADLDLQLLVFVIKLFEESLADGINFLAEYREDEKERLKVLRLGREAQDLYCT